MDLKVSIQSELHVFLVGHDAGLLIVSDPLLEEVGLSVERDVLHEVERVLNLVDLGAAELNKEPVCHVLDVDGHEVAVHSDQVNRKSLGQELDLDDHGLADYFLDAILAWFVKLKIFIERSLQLTENK